MGDVDKYGVKEGLKSVVCLSQAPQMDALLPQLSPNVVLSIAEQKP